VHVVIMGCGRVGASLAAALERLDHSVAVFDKDAQAFRRLGDFHGQQVVGVGYERDVLIEAGIQRAVTHRPVAEGAVATIAAEIEEELRAEGAEASSARVGLAVLERLRVLDPVSYLRFASVYKGFEDVTDFEREVAVLQKSTEPKRHPARSR